MKKIVIILSFIIFLGFFLRLYKVDKNPMSLYWDEVSIGYNAYSVLQTGKDEWGRIYPWFFEAFGEFKFPVAIYLTALSTKFFGLTDFSVRFPSAFLGGSSIVMIYLLGVQIFRKRKIALISAFVFYISPWSIQFSRGMFESNLSIFFLISSLYFLILFLKKKNLTWLFCYVFSAFLCVYSYATMFVILPFLTVLTMIMFSSANIKEKLKQTIFFIAIIFVLYIPFLIHIKNDSYLRFNQVSIFSQNPVLEKVINARIKYGGLSGVFLNKYTAGLINFGKNFISHVDPRFLWPGKDGNPRHYNGFGLIYPIEFVFLIFGGICLFLSKAKNFAFFIVFFMIPFAVSSLTKDSPHALRSFSTVIPFCLMTGCGIYVLSKKKTLKVLMVISYAVLMNIYLAKYYVNSIKSFSAWGTENKLMMKQAKKMNLKNKSVYFTGDYWRSYVYYYYYFGVSPTLVQKNNNSTKLGDVYFGYAKWDKADRRYDFDFKPESLFVEKNYILFLSASEKNFFEKLLSANNAHLVKDFYYNKNYMFSVYEK